MTVDFWMPYMPMLVLMALTLMQDHSGSVNARNQRCKLSATKLAISIKLATTVGHLWRDLDLYFANVYMAWPFYFLLKCFQSKDVSMLIIWGDEVAPIGRVSTRDSKTRGSNSVWSTRKMCEFFRVKMLCWLVVGVANPRVIKQA